MKTGGTSVTQNQSKNQNWKGKGNKISITNTPGSGISVPITSKNDKPTGLITRSKAKNALIQLLKTILENLLSDSETECEDNNSIPEGEETEVDEEYIHVSHSDIDIEYVLINLANESVLFPKEELLGSLEPVEENIKKLITSTSMEMMSIEIEENQNTEVGEVEKKFITSPTDVEVHRKVNLQDAKITVENLQIFKGLCEKYEGIFSKDSTDIGRTLLVTMEIDMGDSPPIQ